MQSLNRLCGENDQLTFSREVEAAGGALTAKQASDRPGTAPALGLRAWEMSLHSIADQCSQGVFAMRLSSWLRSGRSLLVPSSTEKGHRPTRLRKRASAAQFSVERLEARTVLTTFSVLNLADSGLGSLRAVITDAHANPGADLIPIA